MLHGSMVALVTPMHANGDLDIDSLRALAEWHIENETDGIVVVGSTGEAPTLDIAEKQLLFRSVVEQVAGRIPVIAGTGTQSTRHTIELTRLAMQNGVDACLLVTPYYNRPTQEGLYQHYQAVANAVSIPQILYNVPGRTGCDLLPETIHRLAKLPNIIGLKDATGDLDRVSRILPECGEHFTLFSGDDASAMDFILLGGKGVISVAANIAPRLMHDLCAASLIGNRLMACELNQPLIPLYKALTIESNPIPTKWVLSHNGLIPSGIRLPLTPLAAKYHATVQAALKQAAITL